MQEADGHLEQREALGPLVVGHLLKVLDDAARLGAGGRQQRPHGALADHVVAAGARLVVLLEQADGRRQGELAGEALSERDDPGRPPLDGTGHRLLEEAAGRRQAAVRKPLLDGRQKHALDDRLGDVVPAYRKAVLDLRQAGDGATVGQLVGGDGKRRRAAADVDAGDAQ